MSGTWNPDHVRFVQERWLGEVSDFLELDYAARYQRGARRSRSRAPGALSPAVRGCDGTPRVFGGYCLIEAGNGVMRSIRFFDLSLSSPLPNWRRGPDHGDDARVWGPPFWGGDGVLFLAANANKRSVALRLSHPATREAVLRLVDRADICVVSAPASRSRVGSTRRRCPDATADWCM